jgi:hypothetical protein
MEKDEQLRLGFQDYYKSQLERRLDVLKTVQETHRTEIGRIVNRIVYLEDRIDRIDNFIRQLAKPKKKPKPKKKRKRKS